MVNKYKIQQIIDNGTYVKMPFIYSTAATPTFSAITVTNDIITSGQFVGDGSQITNLESNSGITGNFVNKSGDTMSGDYIFNGNLTAYTITITGETNLQGRITNDIGNLVLASSLEPETDRSQTLGTSTKSWGNIFTEFITLEDNSGADQVIIQAPQQTITGDVAWKWELPYTGGTSGQLMGITNSPSGSAQQVNSTWYSLSGVNITINTNTGGTITLSAATLPVDLISSVTTTNATPTELEKIDTLTDNAMHLIEVYVTAISTGATEYGIWKRTLAVQKNGGTVTIHYENSDVDHSSTNLSSTSLDFNVNGGDIDVDVTGIAATTINWNSKYKIITNSSE